MESSETCVGALWIVDIRRAEIVEKARGATREAWNGTRLASEKAVRATDMLSAL